MTKAQFIPISGLHGDNLVERSPHTEWYEGPSFMQALNNLVVPKRPVDKPLRLPIRIINNVKGVGTVIQGRIETGTYQSPN
jgi:elongation factor 1-alpha